MLSYTLPLLPEIIYGEQGKPAFTPEVSLWSDLSHSGDDIALLLSDEGEVGCSIEAIRSRVNQRWLVNAISSLGERAKMDAVRLDQRLEMFWCIWICKGAIIKQRGGSAWQVVSVDSICHFSLSVSHCQPENLSPAICIPTSFTLTTDST